MDIGNPFVILVWSMGIYAFFKIKKIGKAKDVSRHNQIFGKHWTENSIHTGFNYLKLVFLNKNWKEFESKEFIIWVMISYTCNLLAFCIVFYPMVRMVWLIAIDN